jgi:acetyl esterase/lipase
MANKKCKSVKGTIAPENMLGCADLPLRRAAQAILRVIFLILITGSLSTVSAQTFIPIWPSGKKPNSNKIPVTDSLYNERIWRVATPGIYAFIVPRADSKKSAVLICPGGGYERVSHVYNGFNLAKWYNSIGISVFVLVYRLPHQADLKQHELAPLQDAQRAMRVIRAHANDWTLDTARIGVMGVSAGGHVASTLATHPEDVSGVGDSIDAMAYRPNFMILLSPVITLGKYAHAGSKHNFLGADTTTAYIQRFSGELQVSSYTPATFIVHAFNDKTVNVQNSLLFANALTDNKVNVSLHIFPQGGHGIRLDDNPGSTELWTDLLEAWLKEMNFVVPIPFK